MKSGDLRALIVGVDKTTEMGSILEQACIRSGIDPTFDGPGQGESAIEPHLIMGALDANSRAIPDEIVRLGDRFVNSSVVILSAERLVRPTVSLQRGRVLLLSPPHDVSSVSRRMRQALWKVRQEVHLDTARGLDAKAETVAAEVRVSSRYWVGMLSTYRQDADVMRSTSVMPAENNVVVGLSANAGFVDPVSVLPQFGSIRNARDFLAAADSVPNGVLMLGLFGASASEWVVINSGSAARAWIVSPLRLPTIFSLTGRMKRYSENTSTLAALAGDVLVVTLGEEGNDFPELRLALSAGGLGYHDALRARITKEQKSFLSLAVEVI
jgi:hypothetical protein